MKIKTKLNLGIGLLFLLIILLISLGVRYVNMLKNDTERILADNYKSLEYSLNMLDALDSVSARSLQDFGFNLKLQEENITEPGEKEVTGRIRSQFSRFKSVQQDSVASDSIRRDILVLMKMNLEAIRSKGEVAKLTAGKAVTWMGITGAMCFLIALVLLVNLPSGIANPINELTDSIEQIAAKNYSERVHFHGHGEFGKLARSFNDMAAKLEEYNNSNLATILMEKRRIETLINKMTDPVIGLDDKLKIIFVNDEAVKIIGLQADELVGKPVPEVAEVNDLMRSLIRDMPSRGKPLLAGNDPLKVFADDRENYYDKECYEIVLNQGADDGKVQAGFVILLRNVTAYKRLDAAKTNFIATVSHEFKTPIAAIRMSLQLLSKEQVGKLNSEQRHLIDSIQGDTDRLLKIVGELLNLTQVESGNIHLAVLPADVAEVVMYAVNATKVQATQKNIKLELNFPVEPLKMLADKEKTAWVLTNLISNAIRYSYENSIIYLSVQKENSTIRILVRDTGQGIAPQYKDKIFDRYFRIPGTNQEGTGLGLSISKEFMAAQGGQISVESEYGAGSTFVVSLNAAQA